MADLADERNAIALLKDGVQDIIGGAPLSAGECSALLSLIIEADSFISHMRHRRSWPGDLTEVDALIGRLRRAS